MKECSRARFLNTFKSRLLFCNICCSAVLFLRSPMNFLNFWGFGKLQNLLSAIKIHGGLKNSFLQYLRTDELKIGTLVGIDKHGNRYYQNDNFFYGRNRWVIYSDRYGYDYDASQIPAEWYGWLHYKTDLLPSQDKSRPQYKWMSNHTENLTGTTEQYVPFSTTSSKVEAWRPPKI